MNKKDLISVIVPLFNCEDYIDNCIKSIVNQTYRELEIIIIDDGSKDNSYEKCLTWAEQDERIKVLHQENKGVGNARNAGLREASGKYIGFVDADDEIDERMFEVLANNIIQCEGEISIVGYYDVFSDYKEHHQSVGHLSADKEDIIFACLSRNSEKGGGYNTSLWNKLFIRTTIFEPSPILFVEDASVGEDCIWLINVLDRVEKGVIDPTPLYYYTRTRNSSALSLRETYSKHVKDNIEAETYLFQHVKRQSSSKKINRCAANRLYEHCKRVHCKFHSQEEFDFKILMLKNINIGFWHGVILTDEISIYTKMLRSVKYIFILLITLSDMIRNS